MLKKAFTHEGKRLKIRRVPMPDTEELVYNQIVTEKNKDQFIPFGFTVGDTIHRVPAASYVNYFVSNDVVLIPKYWQPGMKESQKAKDDEALRIFSKLFPGRKVIQIFAFGINRGGGGIHCMTHEQPALPIRH